MNKVNHHRGPEHWNWNNGRTTFNGYAAILTPKHPFANARGYVFEHRLIMEKKIGRFLQTNESVHHINGDKTDNRIENLVILSHKKHLRLHANPDAKWNLLDDVSWLKKQADKRKTSTQIAKYIGCTEGIVRIALDKYNIRKIVYGPPRQKFPILRDKQWLSEKIKTMSQQQIANLLGCDRKLVHNCLKEHGLKSSHKPGPKPKTNIPDNLYPRLK